MESSSSRDKIVQATQDLMEAQGCHATGLSQILKKSGAPKGSLYYYFPGGKDQLTGEAIARAGQMMQNRMRQALAADPDPAAGVRGFVNRLAHMLESTDYRSGGPLQMIALETATTNESANLACRAVYQALQGVVADHLAAHGWPADQAAALGQIVLATVEGGVVLSRIQHSAAPLRALGEHLYQVLAASRPAA